MNKQQTLRYDSMIVFNAAFVAIFKQNFVS